MPDWWSDLGFRGSFHEIRLRQLRVMSDRSLEDPLEVSSVLAALAIITGDTTPRGAHAMDYIPDVDEVDIDTDEIAALIGTEGDDTTLIGFSDETTITVQGSVDEVTRRLGLEIDDDA
jgi:hypothetical protein